MNETPERYISEHQSPEQAKSSSSRGIRKPAGMHYSTIKLLIALLFVFFTSPFIDDLPHGDLIDSVLLTLVMVSAVLAVGDRGWPLTVAIILVIPAMAGKWANHFELDLFQFPIYLIPTTVFFLFVVARIFSFLLNARKVDAAVLCAGLSGYLMLGLLWIPAYILVGHMDQGAFAFNTAPDGGHASMAGFDAFYFSFITLCTVGYGDVSPVSNVARMLVVIQAIAGLFYIAVVLAQLVALYSTPALPEKANTSSNDVD